MKNQDGYLSKREQQIMELAYEHGELTAVEVEGLLPGSPSNSTVRTLLRILEEKGHLSHVEEQGRYVYLPVRPRQSAARQALAGVLKTFFGGSVSDVVTALLSDETAKLTDEELAHLERTIELAREEGRCPVPCGDLAAVRLVGRDRARRALRCPQAICRRPARDRG